MIRNKNFWLYVLVLFILTFIFGKNYIFKSGLPLTEDGHGNLGLAWVFKEMILKGKFFSSWDYIGGTPLGVFHPFPMTYIYTGVLLLIFNDPVIALKAAFFVTTLIAGVGMYLAVNAYTKKSYGSFIAGLFYAFNPFFLLEGPVTGHMNLILVYAFLPFLLLFITLAIKKRSLLSLLGGVGIYALIIMTDLQFSVLSTGVLFFYFLVFIFNKSDFNADLKRILFVFGSVFFGGILLTSYQLYSWQLIRSEIALQGFDMKDSYNYSATFFESLTLQTKGLQSKLRYTINFLYLWPMFFIILGFIQAKKKDKWLWGIFYIISIILSMGLNTPLLRYAYNHISLFSYFRVPFRFYFWIIIAASFIVGNINLKSIKSFAPFFKLGNEWRKLIPKIFIAILVLFLMGFLNGPWRWQWFKNFGDDSWINQGNDYEWSYYEWLGNNINKDRNENGRVEHYPVGVGHYEISRLASLIHKRPSFQSAQAHSVAKNIEELVEVANNVVDTEFLANNLGLLNIEYVLPRDMNSYNKLATSSGLLRIDYNQATIFKNEKKLPYLRSVEKSILFLGNDNADLAYGLLSKKGFDLNDYLFVIGNSTDLFDYDSEFFNSFDYLVISDNSGDVLNCNNIKNFDGQVLFCKNDQRCLEQIKIDSNTPRVIKYDYKYDNVFFSAGKGKGRWLVLSEPYFSRWKLKVANQEISSIPVYGALVGFFVPESKSFGTEGFKGEIYFGNNSRQNLVGLINILFLLLYFSVLIYLFYKYIDKCRVKK